MASIKVHAKTLARKLPLVDGYLKRRRQRRRFRVELDLIKGRHRNANTHPSILHFSLNKAATQYTKGILRRCVAQNGMVPVGIHDYAFHTDFPYLDHLSVTDMVKYQHVFKPIGYLYSVFGGMIEGIPEFHRYKVVLMVRDPRDVLVSNYYSVAYSHPAPDKRSGKYGEFLKLRATARSMSVDEYVLANSGNVCGVLHRYKKLLLDKYPETHLARYEDMIANFQDWLKGVLVHCQLPIRDELWRSLMKENEQSRPGKEDIRRHIRKGRPGDFRDKLRAETIYQLDAGLASVLETFGYVGA